MYDDNSGLTEINQETLQEYINNGIITNLKNRTIKGIWDNENKGEMRNAK